MTAATPCVCASVTPRASLPSKAPAWTASPASNGNGKALDLLPLCHGGTVDKTRYLVPAGEKYFEVDVFAGDNEGLVMAEIELDSPDQPFERPAWLGEEVTGDPRYYNSYLLHHPYKNW